MVTIMGVMMAIVGAARAHDLLQFSFRQFDLTDWILWQRSSLLIAQTLTIGTIFPGSNNVNFHVSLLSLSATFR
jgi:hypothetical protein